MAKPKSSTHIAYRNSKNGRFVPAAYAKKHPATTERQHVKNPKR